MRSMISWRLAALGGMLLLALMLQGCGTPYATMKNSQGEEVMLLGHDPVAYFTAGKPTYGDPAIKSTLPERTYYFASVANKRLFDAAPEKYEPQYGGFCASGAAFALKLGSDPTEFEIVGGKLYIFGDVVGHEAWSIDPAWNIRHGDEVWPESRCRAGAGKASSATRTRWPGTRTRPPSAVTGKRSFPVGRARPTIQVAWSPTSFSKGRAGARAKAYGPQPVVGFVGEDACPPACTGRHSRRFGEN
jgi:hypothetical protein